ncbi:hypothetical protein CSA56_02580 [candidate division KSB3 bacterium]|uniref:Uncharacterized protein n=1 Tax=candidate division KSB3 bacterium TaxID=2044937 RepID=A0A2G6KJN9_9BACT|nr:MAG: hypothetical protein CSA56_02580 [candidate division KSB3 bacterium]
MKQKCLWWFLVMIVSVGFVCVMGGDSWASERTLGWSTGVSFGPSWFLNGDFGTGGSGRVFLEYAPYIPEVGIRLTGGYFYFEDTVTTGSGTFSASKDANYTNAYVTGGIVYRLSRRHIVPFLEGNLGVYHYDKDKVEASGVGPIIDGEQVSSYAIVDTKTGFAFGVNGGGGVEWFMSDRLSLSLESLIHLTLGEESDQIFDVTAMFRFLPGKK